MQNWSDVIWSVNCVNTYSTVAGTFAIIDSEFYVLVVTLSTQDSTKLLEQLKFRFKKTTKRNKCKSEVTAQNQNQHPDYLIDSSFQWVKGLFVLSFKNITDRTGQVEYYLPTTEIKGYSVMTDDCNFFIKQLKMT